LGGDETSGGPTRVRDRQKRVRRRPAWSLVALWLGFSLAACTAAPYFAPPERSAGFTNFETEPLRPLLLSADGQELYVLNTADDRLEIFAPTASGLSPLGEARLGLRPIAMTLRRPGELWVVNHLSDSVNVVDVNDPARPLVRRTLQVGDEPRGIVAAGPDNRWVLVAAARRGDSLTPGIGRAQVWVFDGLDAAAPPQKLTLFATKPRALAVSPDGTRVYAAAFHSGNRTAIVGGIAAARLGRAPIYDADNRPQPEEVPKAGTIVSKTPEGWRDFQGYDWSALVPFDLPDYDVFVIDASGRPQVVERISGVGTTLFDLAVRPGDGEVWVSNTEAANHLPHEPRLRGRFVENRITRLSPGDAGWSVTPQDLNAEFGEGPMPAAELLRANSLAQPLQVAFEPTGAKAYVAAFGSGKVGVLDGSGRVTGRIAVGFGPAGLALDAARGRLYVMNRFDATISVIDTARESVIATVPLGHDPTPAAVKAGRPLLYDAAATSGRGTVSCASCHVFGDFDGLAWDLGNPGGDIIEMPAGLEHPLFVPQQEFHPLKGPMMTQSLRGLANSGPLHWRGDRFGRDAAVPGEDLASFQDFDIAYVDLMGLDSKPGKEEMAAFARFVHSIRYPPNPNEPPDRVLNSTQAAGFRIFNGGIDIDRGIAPCNDCHAAPLGTNRLINFEGAQAGRDMKTAHLRNVYQKVGRFDVAGPQVTAYGIGHDGSQDTVVNFLRLDVFHFPGKTAEERDSLRRQLNAFIMAFHTGMAPAVGLQTTVAGAASPEARSLIDMMASRATLGDCDLTARSYDAEGERGWLWQDGTFLADRRDTGPSSLENLLALGRGAPVTFLCVPPGDGLRAALDRDLDGLYDGDETRP
jgi:YVTN family beta-propeller protein